MPTPEELEQLRKASEKSAEKARELLDAEVKAIMDEVARIGELKPKTADEETYNKLVEAVTEATNRNESIVTLKENVKKLGDSAVSLFKEMVGIAKALK
jgi:hypothetical protein